METTEKEDLIPSDKTSHPRLNKNIGNMLQLFRRADVSFHYLSTWLKKDLKTKDSAKTYKLGSKAASKNISTLTKYMDRHGVEKPPFNQVDLKDLRQFDVSEASELAKEIKSMIKSLKNEATTHNMPNLNHLLDMLEPIIPLRKSDRSLQKSKSTVKSFTSAETKETTEIKDGDTVDKVRKIEKSIRVEHLEMSHSSSEGKTIPPTSAIRHTILGNAGSPAVQESISPKNSSHETTTVYTSPITNKEHSPIKKTTLACETNEVVESLSPSESDKPSSFETTDESEGGRYMLASNYHTDEDIALELEGPDMEGEVKLNDSSEPRGCDSERKETNSRESDEVRYCLPDKAFEINSEDADTERPSSSSDQKKEASVDGLDKKLSEMNTDSEKEAHDKQREMPKCTGTTPKKPNAKSSKTESTAGSVRNIRPSFSEKQLKMDSELIWKKRPRRVLIIKKLHDPEHSRPFLEFLIWLKKNYPKLEIFIENQALIEESTRDLPDAAKVEQICKVIDSTDLGRLDIDSLNIDLAISIGGDGTLLYTASLFPRDIPPIVPFRTGTVNYLVPFKFEREVIEEVLHAVFTGGKARLHLRARIKCVHMKNQAIVKEYTALNEVAVTRGCEPHLCKILVYLNHTFMSRVDGDGLIMCTPTGSTAYSLAAGGSLLQPQVPCFQLTPIAPFSICSRAVVLPQEDLEVAFTLAEDSRSSANVNMDGTHSFGLDKEDILVMSKSPFPLPIVHLNHPEMRNYSKQGKPSKEWFQSFHWCKKVVSPAGAVTEDDGDILNY